MLPTNPAGYYPTPQGHPNPYYYPPAGPAPGYFNPYQNLGLGAPQLPQIPPQTTANDSGIHSQPPSPDEEDKENVQVFKPLSKAKQASLNDDERKKYREKRDRNNQAAKLSRMHRKQREQKLSAELVQMHETNKQLNQELFAYKEHQRRFCQSIHENIEMLKASGVDVTNLLSLLQDNSSVPVMPNPAFMQQTQTPGFHPFF
ncbi:hypothetical protein L596_029447 [Steinernema carpocapsae]|uniref:BZIP domain-containing protein n=1 Tax=Steinernema carpocapsae TaxID=34508 RepID=A0A4U5LUN9_STECR|nr:hypothetical protein L596_029447 [Steinernema carpocapsae]